MSKNPAAVELGRLGKGKPKRLSERERIRRRRLMMDLNARRGLKTMHGSKISPVDCIKTMPVQNDKR